MVRFGYGKETIILTTEQTGNKVTIICLEQNESLLALRCCSQGHRVPDGSCQGWMSAFADLHVNAMPASGLQCTEV